MEVFDIKRFIKVFLIILLAFNFSVTISAEPPFVESIEIKGDKIITMYVGDEITLEAIAVPCGTNYAYMIWTTNNENIITLTGDDGTTLFTPPVSTATVKALLPGTAVVSVHTDLWLGPYPDEYTVNDSVTINVLPKESAPGFDGEISVNSISFNISLKGDTSKGTVWAAVYDANGKINAVNHYPAADTVNVVFNAPIKGSYVKIMWWDENMRPICQAQTIKLQ